MEDSNQAGGSATLTDCLFQGNSVIAQGGGILSRNGAEVTLIRTRVTDNSAGSGGSFLGSGIYNFGGTATLQDGSIVCANHPTANQCFGVTLDGTSSCPADCP